MAAKVPLAQYGGLFRQIASGDTVDPAYLPTMSGGPLVTDVEVGAGPTLGTTEATIGTVVVNVPSTSSKVWIIARVNLVKDAGTTVRTATIRVRRGSTNGDPQVGRDSSLRSQGVATSDFGPGVVVAQDVPGVTGNVTYTVRGLAGAAASATTPHYEIQAVILEGAIGPAGPAGPAGSNGTGDVTGPASAVTARIATFNGTTGKIIQDGGSTVADVLARANHTGTQTLDTTTDTGTRVAMTPAERTKLTGVATGATANDTDANLRARSSHTGTQAIATILAAASSRFFGRITASGGPGEEMTPTQATSLLDLATGALKGLMSSADKTKLDGVATGATANSADATLLARANHTGTQTLDTTTDTGTRVAMTPAERTKLTGVATGATANATDAQLRDRATHTGAQAISTVTNLQTSLDGRVDKASTPYSFSDANLLTETGGHTFASTALNTPTSDSATILSSGGGTRNIQIGNAWNAAEADAFFIRRNTDGTWSPWRKLWNSGNTSHVVQGVNDSRSSSGGVENMNTPQPSGFIEYNPGTPNTPVAGQWAWALNFRHTNTAGGATNQYGWQLSNAIGTNDFYVRGVDAGNWRLWDKVITSRGDNGRVTLGGRAGNTNYERLAVGGGVLATGSDAQLGFEDRATFTPYAWYGNGGLIHLWSGNANAVTVATNGDTTVRDLYVKRADNTGVVFYGTTQTYYTYWSGTEYIIQSMNTRITHNLQVQGTTYLQMPVWNLSADGIAWIRQPRTFVQASDPGAAAADGDIWMW